MRGQDTAPPAAPAQNTGSFSAVPVAKPPASPAFTPPAPNGGSAGPAQNSGGYTVTPVTAPPQFSQPSPTPPAPNAGAAAPAQSAGGYTATPAFAPPQPGQPPSYPPPQGYGAAPPQNSGAASPIAGQGQPPPPSYTSAQPAGGSTPPPSYAPTTPAGPAGPAKTGGFTRMLREKRKLLVVIAIILVAAIACAIFIPLGIHNARQTRYNSAVTLLENGQYRQAADEFYALGDFDDAAARRDECVRPFPATGETFHDGNFVSSATQLIINTPADDGSFNYLKIYTQDDTLVSCVAIAPGASASLGLPPGVYRIKTAFGYGNWYAEKEMFGDDGYYQVLTFDDAGTDTFEFQDNHEYTLSLRGAGAGAEGDSVNNYNENREEF